MTQFKMPRVARILAFLACGAAWTAASSGCGAQQPARAPDAVAASEPASFSPKQDAAMVEEFGTTTGKPIDAGFAFFDGIYIESPYVVSRKGGTVYIDDQWVHHTAGDDRPALMAYPEAVRLPDDIDKNTSLHDKRLGEYFRSKRAAVQARHTPAEEREIMEADYRSLPNIKEARLDDRDPGILHVTTYSGETSSIRLDVPRRKPRTDGRSRYEEAEMRRKSLEQGLQEGCCYFFFSRGGHTVFGNGKRDLPRLVEALRSADSVEEKLTNLKSQGFRWSGECPFLEIVATFSESQPAQLERRIANLSGSAASETPQ